jgi:hypothetical protein
MQHPLTRSASRTQRLLFALGAGIPGLAMLFMAGPGTETAMAQVKAGSAAFSGGMWICNCVQPTTNNCGCVC